MTCYRHLIPPLLPIGGGAIVSNFSSLVVDRLRNKEKGRQRAELDDWEGEGGRVAASHAVAP